MTTKSITSITDGQKKQYLRFVEDAAENALKKVGLDKDSIQKLIEKGDKLQSHIIWGIQKLSVSDQFNEKVGYGFEGGYYYPSGYQRQHVSDQIACLREMFPQLGTADADLADEFGKIPPNAEGLFAIPRWEKIAPTYSAALEKVLALITQARNGTTFWSYGSASFGPNLRQNARTAAMFQKLGEQQKGHDILIFPAQFGHNQRGRCSVRVVRRILESAENNEFGLGAFAVGIMLLTHPKRFQHDEELGIDCAGDEYDKPDSVDDDRFSYAPSFEIHDGEVQFAMRHTSIGYGNYCGSASGFLPQQAYVALLES